MEGTRAAGRRPFMPASRILEGSLPERHPKAQIFSGAQPQPKTEPERDIKHRELLDSWEVDFRNVVFAAEDDPRDLYFSISRIVEKRRMVFRELGGSVVCLSPLGSKLLSVGGLLAAMEFNLPVAYVEANSYDLGEGNEWSG